MFLAVTDVLVILTVEFPGGSDLLVPGRNLDALCALNRTRPVLERHTRVAQIRVLERYHFVP